MTTLPVLSPVSESDLLSRGFFHDRMIPPLSTLSLSGPPGTELVRHARAIMSTAADKGYHSCLPVRSRCVQHSVPKRKHLRRVLSIPNPLHQSILCCEIVDHWKELLALCSESEISLTTPQQSVRRAIESVHDRQKEAMERAKRSVGARYVLKTDIARFYPSIYTHSIGWAIHGKADARADKSYNLYGNRIDLWLRETQDKQTGGIPIGPDTSLLVAELIASRLDKALQKHFARRMKGTRYIDDYNLYFANRGDAEKALAVLHGAAREYELEISDLKTEITELPEPLEPYWKTQLRSIELRSKDHGTSLKAFFDRGFELAKEFSQDSVLTYIAKKVKGEIIAPEDWDMCEVLLLRSALGEPSLLPELAKIFEKNNATGSTRLREAIEALCHYHSPLQQASEVAWSLWIARSFNLRVSKETAETVVTVDDDIVALVSLDMMSAKLMPKVPTPLWNTHMNADSLYSDHWLLAYEAYEQGWLRPPGVKDYVAADTNKCFQILRNHKVRFYDPTNQWKGGSPDYSEESTDADEDDGVEDDSDSPF